MPALQERDRWIWPFELQEKIGEGGMGVVYRARYVVNDRQVAVKLIPSDVTDSLLLARFERELEILKTLRHPNIVRCFGGACEDKRRFYAMELVEGGTLDELLQQRGRLSWEQVIEYGRQMCAALSHAHAQGVVHRDVKPANFLVTAAGKLKLSDFGLATVAAGRKITRAGKTMGTYCYMAPEQIRGKDVTPRTDLYALGCVLFELIAGRPPFLGDTPAEILQQHLKQPPAKVTEFAPDCPAALEKLIADLLEKGADARPADAAAVAVRLGDVTQTVIVQVPRKSGNGRIGNRPTSDPISVSGPAEQSAPAVRPITTPTWLLAAAVVVIGGLLAWNLSLHQQRRHLERAEALWLETYRDASEPTMVRTAAARALGELGPASPRAVEALVEGLSDEHREVRRATFEALGETGAAARDVLNVLRRTYNREEFPEVRAAGIDAVQKISQAPTDRVPIGSYLFFTVLTVLAVAGGMWATMRLRHAQPPPISTGGGSRPAN